MKTQYRCFTLKLLLCLLPFVSPAHAAMIDIMLVLDRSGSFEPDLDRINAALSPAVNSVFSASDDVRFGLVTFSDDATLDVDLGAAAAVSSALDNVVFGGSMEVGAQAVSLATTASFRPNAQKHIIVFTDEPGDMTTQDIVIAGDQVKYLPATLWAIVTDSSISPNNYAQLLLASDSFNAHGSPNLLVAEGLAIDFAVEQTLMSIQVQSNAAVPLPGAVWLFGSALLGLGALRRNK